MITTLLISIISSNAGTNEENKSIIYSRLVIQGITICCYIVYNNMFINSLEKGIGLFGGMFSINIFTQSFNLFTTTIISLILILTSFYPNTVSSIKLSTGTYFIDTHIFNKDKDENTSNNERPDNINEDKNSINENKDDIEKNRKLLDYNITSKASTTFRRIMNNSVSNIIDILSDRKSGKFTIIEYALIIIFVLCGAVFLMSSGDLISMFLSIELQSYGLYILSTLYRDSESSTNSGLIYFLLGGMSSCFILFGSGILYINSGTTNIENICIINSIYEPISNLLLSSNIDFEAALYVYLPRYIGISLIIMMVGFLFKVSAAPFHFWSPDVYDGIPTVVTTFVATVAKISIFIFIIQLIINIDFSSLQETTSNYTTLTTLNIKENSYENITNVYMSKWKEILVMSSLMSLLVGSILGLTQHRIKRLFAYSTISHVGFILLALSVNTVESIQAYIFYIIQYTISNINAFIILIGIGYILYSTISSGYKSNKISKLVDIKNSPIQLISQLKGYFHIDPYISISLAITLFSFAGIPPLMGFFAKQMVLSSALDGGYIFIALIAIITSVIGAVYYLNIVKNMFFSYPDSSFEFENVYKLHFQNEKSEDFNIDHSLNNDVYYEIYARINSALSTVIATMTVIILSFICVPDEWLSVASILSITLKL